MSKTEKPFTLAEVEAIVELYEALHGQEQAKIKLRDWAAPKTFTEPAFQYIIRYIE